MRTSTIIFALSLSAVSTTGFAQGPTDNYYLTSGQDAHNVTVNGQTSTLFNQAVGYEYPIAVYGDIRTAGYGGGGIQGAQYNLGWTDQGTRYNNFPNNGIDTFFDGASDGVHNFTVGFNSGKVYETNRDWTGMTTLFALTSGQDLGITYDPNNNSIWLSNWVGKTITDYAMNGAILSSFDAPVASMTCLAFDPGDGTLWFGSQATEGTYYQFSTTGNQLQQLTYNNLTTVNTLGGEFNMQATPEPVSLVAVAVGGVAALRRRRSSGRRRAA